MHLLFKQRGAWYENGKCVGLKLAKKHLRPPVNKKNSGPAAHANDSQFLVSMQIKGLFDLPDSHNLSLECHF